MGIPTAENPECSVLNLGYVRLLRVIGTDLDVANDARASFAKESEALTDGDLRLIDTLAADGHQAPFRAQGLKFEIKAPLMVARQWWKYKVASQHIEEMDGWSEASRRYVTRVPEFYTPAAFRLAAADRKQGSAGEISEADNLQWLETLAEVQALGQKLYRQATAQGMCGEQARLFLPAYGMYTTWRWQASLPAIFHFYQERTQSDAQDEIQHYAHAVGRIAQSSFPVAWEALVHHSSKSRANRLKNRLLKLVHLIDVAWPKSTIGHELRAIADSVERP